MLCRVLSRLHMHRQIFCWQNSLTRTMRKSEKRMLFVCSNSSEKKKSHVYIERCNIKSIHGLLLLLRCCSCCSNAAIVTANEAAFLSLSYFLFFFVQKKEENAPCSHIPCTWNVLCIYYHVWCWQCSSLKYHSMLFSIHISYEKSKMRKNSRNMQSNGFWMSCSWIQFAIFTNNCQTQ